MKAGRHVNESFLQMTFSQLRLYQTGCFVGRFLPVLKIITPPVFCRKAAQSQKIQQRPENQQQSRPSVRRRRGGLPAAGSDTTASEQNRHSAEGAAAGTKRRRKR